MTTTNKWRLVPVEPDQAWTDAFAARGPRIGSFSSNIRAVLDTAPAPGFTLVTELQAIRAALAFLPAGDAAVSGLDRIIGQLDGAPNHMPSNEPCEPSERQEEPLRQAVMDAIAAALGSAYDCTRVWSAWGVGTMSWDDFCLVTDDAVRLGELADAAIAAMKLATVAGDAPGTVSLVTRPGPGQQLFTYTSQPCGNVIAWRIGEACCKANQASAGDYIDRGLGLLKELQAKGYGIAAIAQQSVRMEA